MKLFETLHKNNYTLNPDKELGYDESNIRTIQRFIAFCIEQLGLATHFNVALVADREEHGIKTTAFYREQDKTAMIYAKGRMLGDVMRSLAHELVHKQQWEQGRIKLPVPDVGGPIEDEANAMAGVLVKKFINDDPEGKNLFI